MWFFQLQSVPEPSDYKWTIIIALGTVVAALAGYIVKLWGEKAELYKEIHAIYKEQIVDLKKLLEDHSHE